MWAKYPRSEVKQPRGDEVGLQEQSSEGSGNVQTLLPKIYWPGQRDGEAILEINKRYLATGWSRGRSWNGWRMKCREVTIWQGNKWKREDTVVSFFYPDSRSFICLALVKLAGSKKESHQQYFVQLIYQTNVKQLFQSTKMTSKKLKNARVCIF